MSPQNDFWQAAGVSTAPANDNRRESFRLTEVSPAGRASNDQFMTPLRVALLGLGNVGGGVAKILLEHSERVARRAGRPIELRHVIVRDLRKARAVILPA